MTTANMQERMVLKGPPGALGAPGPPEAPGSFTLSPSFHGTSWDFLHRLVLSTLGLSGPLYIYTYICIFRPLWASLGLSVRLCASLRLSGLLWASLGLSGSTSEAPTHIPGPGCKVLYQGTFPWYLLGLFRLQGTTANFHGTSWDFLHGLVLSTLGLSGPL